MKLKSVIFIEFTNKSLYLTTSSNVLLAPFTPPPPTISLAVGESKSKYSVIDINKGLLKNFIEYISIVLGFTNVPFAFVKYGPPNA